MTAAIRRAVCELLGDMPGALVESPGGHVLLADWLSAPGSDEFASLSSGEQAMVRAAMSLHSGAVFDLFTHADRAHVERFVGALVEIVRTTAEGDEFIRAVKSEQP
jgi:hypothetical protein